jgi:hypothetical protein
MEKESSGESSAGTNCGFLTFTGYGASAMVFFPVPSFSLSFATHTCLRERRGLRLNLRVLTTTAPSVMVY